MDRVSRQVKSKPQPRISSAGLDAALMASGPKATYVNAFAPAHHPPKATPPKGSKLGMDSALDCNATNWAAGVIEQSYSEGLQWLGYPYLAELAQRPEYRVITETIAGEMTRKWIRFEAVGEAQNKTERIKQLEDKFKDLEVQDNFRSLAEQDGYFGRSHLYLDTGDTDNRDELALPIGDGQNKISKVKVGKRRPIQRIKTVEAVWAYPTYYDSIDPLKPDWYKPQQWFVMGKQIHVSRLLTFVGRPVPDLLKPAYSFGGLSLSQIAKPYVDAWLRTRTSVNDLIHSFVVWGLKTNLAESLQPGGDLLFKRIELFNRLRDNRGMMLTDKETEEFFNVVTPLGSLDALQAQSQEHMMSVARIPAVKFTGIQPTGLNASSEGELRTFYDTIGSYQHNFFRKNLTRLMHFVMLSMWGEVDPEITFSFEPLWSLNEKEEAEVRKTDAETGQIYVDSGTISQEEERKRITQDPGSPYAGLDPNEMPDLKEEEEGGLEPEGGRPDPDLTGEGPEAAPKPTPKAVPKGKPAPKEPQDEPQEGRDALEGAPLADPTARRGARSRKLGKLVSGIFKEAAE